MDNRDINSNSIDNNSVDDKDLFSYDNSGNIVEEGKTSFDLNSFSSKSNTVKDTNEKVSKNKKPRKKKNWLNSVL